MSVVQSHGGFSAIISTAEGISIDGFEAPGTLRASIECIERGVLGGDFSLRNDNDNEPAQDYAHSRN